MTLLRSFAATLESIRNETHTRHICFQVRPDTENDYGCMVTDCADVRTVDCHLKIGANEIIMRVCPDHAQKMSDDFSKELSR
jgi:hypothetical protein